MLRDRTASVNTVGGPGSAAIKYDILTALLVTAARGDPVPARLSMRLSLLITARFNWRTGCFAVGVRELARMWGVTERTAKREMAAMRANGWISVSVPAARGRVAQYQIDLLAILRETMPHWEAVGPDFAARMTPALAPQGQTAPNVVPLHRTCGVPCPDDGSPWSIAARRLQSEDPVIYGAWFAALQPLEMESGLLTLMAPSAFIADYIRTHYHTRLLAALVADDRSVRDVQIVAGSG